MSLNSDVAGATSWDGRNRGLGDVSCYYAEVGSHLNGQPRLIASHERSHLSGKFWRKLLSDSVRGALPNDSSLVDLGQHRLRDVAEMEQLFQLAHPELRSNFPPLTTSSQSRKCESGTSPPLHQ